MPLLSAKRPPYITPGTVPYLSWGEALTPTYRDRAYPVIALAWGRTIHSLRARLAALFSFWRLATSGAAAGGEDIATEGGDALIELGIRQASALIDELKSDEPTTTGSNGNGAYATGGAR